MYLSYVFRAAPAVALVTLGAAAAAAAIDYRSTVSAQAQPAAPGGQPGAPTNLRATVSDSNVSLSWGPGHGSSPRIYILEAGSREGAADLVVAPMTTTSTVAPNVPDGIYFVRVKASNTSGNSGPSNEVQVRVGCNAAPAPPTGLVANVSGANVGVTWSSSAGARSYLLEVGSASGAANLGTTPVTGTSMAAANVPNGIYYLRVKATNRCGTSGPSNEAIAAVGVAAPAPIAPTLPTPPAPTPGSIFGIVDASILGTCSAATHDRWVVDGGDGFRYRTWHPQTDPSGCVYGHEHGDNPASIQETSIAASPVRFGYIGRRHPMPGEPNGHEEAHEGFKVFIANRGDVNDEGRVNRVYSRSVFHMGTGGPKRFNMPHHSAEIRLIHPEFGLKAFTQLMMNTGGVGAVCDPRKQAPVKDVMQLNSPCKLNSGYEILEHRGVGDGQRPRGLPGLRDAGGVRPDHALQSGQPDRGRLRVGRAGQPDQELPRRRLVAQPRLRSRELRPAGLLVQRPGADRLLHRRDGATAGVRGPVGAAAGDLDLRERRIAGHDRRSQAVQDAQGLLPAELEAGPEELS